MFSRNRNQLKYKYKLTEDAYRDLLINQYFKCKICDTKTYDCGRLEVDHCHKTGKIRGLLCHQCNNELGRFERGKLIRSHLVNPEKEYTEYLNTKVDMVSRFEQAAVRVRNANWYSNRRRTTAGIR